LRIGKNIGSLPAWLPADPVTSPLPCGAIWRARWCSLPGRAGSHLLKRVHFEQDTQGLDLELRYFRDLEGREVDFVVVEDRKPRLLVECKWEDAEPDRGLRYLKARFPQAQAWQLSAVGSKDYQTREGIRVAPALALLRTLA